MHEYSRDFCDLRHKEVEEVKESMKHLQEKIDKKFTAFNVLLITLLFTVIAELIVLIVKGGVK